MKNPNPNTKNEILKEFDTQFIGDPSDKELVLSFREFLASKLQEVERETKVGIMTYIKNVAEIDYEQKENLLNELAQLKGERI